MGNIRIPGTFNFSSNYEALISAPLDARLSVPEFTGLTDGTSIPYPYLGMLVAVTEDPDNDKNGVYFCYDVGSTPTFASNTTLWVKLADVNHVFNGAYITGGTISGSTLTMYQSNGVPFDVDISYLLSATNTYVTGGTVDGNTLTLYRNDGVEIPIDVSTLYSDVYITGGTVDGTTLTLVKNDGSTIDLDFSELLNAGDTYVTGGTATGTTIVLFNNDGSQVPIDIENILPVDTNTFITGTTIVGNNLILYMNDTSSIIIDLSTVAIPGADTYVTGGTVTGSILTLYKNDGDEIDIDVSSLVGGGGGSVSGDTYVTGGSISGTVITFTKNDGQDFPVDINDVELANDQYKDGISNHKFIKIGVGDFTGTTVSGMTMQKVDVLTTVGKMNIIVVDLTTATNQHHLLELPQLTTNYTGALIKVIVKRNMINNLSYNLMLYSPYDVTSSGATYQIIAPYIRTYVPNVGYFVPLETMESIELIFDGEDYLVTNIAKQAYVAMNAFNFATPISAAYRIRNINNLL